MLPDAENAHQVTQEAGGVEDEGWRLLSRGNGRFGLALGSGFKREWLEGYETRDIPEERKQQHAKESKQQRDRRDLIEAVRRGNSSNRVTRIPGKDV